MLKYFIQLSAVIITIIFGLSDASYGGGLDHTAAKEAILIDFDTGTVLFEKNADQKMPTSSMSKIMSIYVVFGALKEGRLSLDTRLPVSEKAWRKGGSKMFVEAGKRVKVEDLIRGVVIQSGNDAAIVLAEGLSGSEDSFAKALNDKAAYLKMNNSHFMNASGWPDPDHYSTARDMSTLAIHLIKDFPEYYHYFSETEYTYNNIKQNNRNPLLYRDMGADGIKTGHTESGGYGLMGAGIQNGRHVVLVVNGLKDNKARAQEGARLLEWGLKGFENVLLFKADEIVESAYVVMGKERRIPMMIEKDLNITLPISVKNDLKVEIFYEGPLQAPLKKGQTIGTLKITVPRLKTIEVPLVAASDVEHLGFFASSFSKAKLFLGGGDSFE